jgi:hypothetical protein
VLTALPRHLPLRPLAIRLRLDEPRPRLVDRALTLPDFDRLREETFFFDCPFFLAAATVARAAALAPCGRASVNEQVNISTNRSEQVLLVRGCIKCMCFSRSL